MESVRLLPVLVVALVVLLSSPSLIAHSRAWGQTPPSSSGTAAPGSAPSGTPPSSETGTVAPSPVSPSQAPPPQAAPTTIPPSTFPGTPTSPATPPEGPAPAPGETREQEGAKSTTPPEQPAAQPPPFYLPQYPSQFPPGYQAPGQVPGLPQPTPLANPLPATPGAPVGPGQIPPWTPPVAPAPAQAHPPLLVPQTLAALPATKLFTFSPTLGLYEIWTDNFNFTVNDKQTNYRTVVGPGFNAVLNAPTTKATLAATWGFTYDTAASSSDNFNVFPSLAFNLIQTFTPRLNLTLTDTYT